jgi:hypothetical protein
VVTGSGQAIFRDCGAKAASKAIGKGPEVYMLVGGLLLVQDTDAEITGMLDVLEKQHHLARKAVRH